jgi:hypothetical protein
MRSAKARLVGATAICLAMLSHAAPSFAQGVEVSPFYGYRFGGSFVELYTPQPFDFDGAPATGVVFDVRLYDGDDFQIEGLFTHQAADVLVAPGPGRPVTQWRVSADHWLAGGLQEFSGGPVRAFTTGMLGLTRYAAEGNSEFRFTVSAGTGVKMFADRWLGVRFDGRVLATFVDGSGNAIACTPGVCLVGLHVNVAWQADFTAGVTVRFP